MSGIGGRRAALATVVTALIAVLAVVTAVALTGPPPEPPRPLDLTDEQRTAQVQRQAEDALLRQRLGGLAGLVVDDPALAGCADAAPPVPAATGDDAVAAVWAQVERLRQLSATDRVEVRLLEGEAMTARVREVFGQRWDEQRLDADQRLLAALGALPPGADLAALRVDAFAEQVSGYFAPADRVAAVRVTDPDQLSPLERVVLAHELEHALTFEHLGRPATDGSDARRAASAVVEGSAVLLMRWYADRALTDVERAQLRAELLAVAHADPMAGYSPYLRAELRFPYVEGVRYVCERWRDGGWPAVDEAYRQPPAHTAEVMFGWSEPARLPAPSGHPGAGWQQVQQRDFGAAELQWLLAAPGGDSAAAVATVPPPAKAWGGGELVLWTSGEASAVGLALVDRGRGPPLCETVRSWYAAAFPKAQESTQERSRTVFTHPDQEAVLACEEDQVRLGIAPSLAEAAAVAR